METSPVLITRACPCRDTLSDTPGHFELFRYVAPCALECLDFAWSGTQNGGQGSDALG